MYAVVGEYCGTVAWWGLYDNLETANHIAEKVNGKVVLWS